MSKISITLPNETAISLEADTASELQEMVALFKSSLLTDLVQLPSEAYWGEDVTTKPNKSISVPYKAFSHPSVMQPIGDRNGQNGAITRDDSVMENPLDTPGEEANPSSQAPTESHHTTLPDTSILESPLQSPDPTPLRLGNNTTSDVHQNQAVILSKLSDPRMGHDFSVFCRTVDPIGDMRKVVVAAEGATRMFSMENVDVWELGHLFNIAGWPQPHSLTQTLRNAARSKFRWLERVPGRGGRYSVTDDGRSLVLKGTKFLLS